MNWPNVGVRAVSKFKSSDLVDNRMVQTCWPSNYRDSL